MIFVGHWHVQKNITEYDNYWLVKLFKLYKNYTESNWNLSWLVGFGQQNTEFEENEIFWNDFLMFWKFQSFEKIIDFRNGFFMWSNTRK